MKTLFGLVVVLMLVGCATGLGGGEVMLRKYEVPIKINGNDN